MTADIAATERLKYQRMYETDQYRNNRETVRLAKEFIRRAGIKAGASVLDVGCGSGYATQFFHSRGLRVVSADIAPNAILPEMAALTEFHCLPAWDLPADRIQVEYGFSTDMMEHIPEERVDDTLAAIRACVTRDAYFNVSLRKDGMGRLINDTLHMTVRPLQWWLDAFARHWGDPVELLHVDYRERSAGLMVGPGARPTPVL